MIEPYELNHFKVRTGTRTYDAAGYLRSLGADPILVDEYIKDTFEEIQMKSHIMSNVEDIGSGIIIASVDDKLVSRSIISQVGDLLLGVKDIEAAFIISKINSEEVGVSARSNGKINVQMIMEKMHGGGHMTAAGVQVKTKTVEEVKRELLNVVHEYIELKEAENNESNIIK